MHLSINIDHIATIRNARGGREPDPVDAARVVERAGADGIVCHLREDRRHINDRDVERLRKSITTKLDLEMAATPEIVRIALSIRPDLVTLVPERRQELTTEGGLDVCRLKVPMRRTIQRFHDRGIPVSLFIDPRNDQIETSGAIGADAIELHTGEYANASGKKRRAGLLRQLQRAAVLGRSIGLVVNAGHGLDYSNIAPVVGLRQIQEVSIGYAIIVRSLDVGLDEAVREMKRLVTVGAARGGHRAY